MKLRSLRVHGFKSFPDSTRIEFHDGITAVVGPNGCGKSNIGDAIRWVLGEQRPSAIRGAKMEEVIFQGAASRKPVNRASVAMAVSNEDGVLPTPFEEVEIGRTVYRDGGSDYTLNRTACRLRDIVDLCRDTGLGANAYAVIEIKMIDAILSERTDERRSLFEEAAGIGKYKDRRRAALRRLETSEVDLRRVEDVIAEVRTKVRSLARQKGKAQRWQELRARRLGVEAAVVRIDLELLDARLAELDGLLESGREEGAGVAARLGAAEADLEKARLAQIDSEKGRVEAAGRFDAVRTELAGVETEVAVARERIAAAERRAEQVATEQERLAKLRVRSQDELAGYSEEQAQNQSALEVVQSDLKDRRNKVAQVRGRLDAARRELRELEERVRAVSTRIARAEGNRTAARIQEEELGRRLERLARDAREGAGALKELRSQGDLFSVRTTEAAAKATKASREFDGSRRRLELLREELRRARERERSAEAGLSALDAELAALRRAVEAGEGTEALAAAARGAFPELVAGALPDFVRVAGASARVVDDALGRFGSALVVRNGGAVERLEEWYCSGAVAQAPLALLPLDAAPRPRGALPAGVSAYGEGAPWVRALLGGVDVSGGDASGPAEGTAAARRWADSLGAVHLLPGRAAGDAGALERRDRIESLETDREAARRELEDARSARAALEEDHARCESETDTASERLLEARDEARAADSEAAAHTDRHRRLDRRQEELARQLAGTKAAREKAAAREREAEAEGARLVQEESDLAVRVDERRTALVAVDAEWEQARDAESEAAIRAARLESQVERLRGRVSDVSQAMEQAAAGTAELGRESARLADELEAARRSSRQGGERAERLFRERDQAKGVLAERDEALREASEAVMEAERRVRTIRQAEREAADAGHRLELERQDVRNRAERVRERLEGEWGRPLEALLEEAEPVEGAADDLRAELAEIVERLAKIGPVNMLAVEEHAEESARLEFLSQQQEDLAAARDDLRAAIRRINATATELFMTSFEAIRKNFQDTFRHLFSGGEASLWLADPENPLESPVEIHAAPRGKRTQRIDLLSGGERALTALSLLFGIYLVKPSPLCVLDEVDAPLDESNIGRFIRLLQGFKARTQFVVITHNPRTIEAADWIYGVTMEEPGVSSIVGVRLEQPQDQADADAG